MGNAFGGYFSISVEVPVLSIEHKMRKQMPVINVQDFSDATLSQMNVPCVAKGFGSSLSGVQAAFQAFAIGLKKEAAKKGFLSTTRLMDDLQVGDAKVLEGLLSTLFVKKLSAPAQARFIMWPTIPDAVSLPTLTTAVAPVLFGNVGCFEGTTYEKMFMGSLRFAFSGRRVVCAAPWSEVLQTYTEAFPPKSDGEKVQPTTAKAVREWFRNLTEDPSYNCFKSRRVVSEFRFMWSTCVHAVQESVGEQLASNMYYGVVGESEGFLCPPGWVYSELCGTANLVGLRLFFHSSTCMPDFKNAFESHKQLQIQSAAGEGEAEAIITKLEEHFAALTPWTPPLPESKLPAAEEIPPADAESKPESKAEDVANNEGGPQDDEDKRLFPKELEKSLDQPQVGERWAVFSSVDDMNCIAEGCRVFVRKENVFIDNDTILDANIAEIIEVHEEDGTVKIKYMFKEGELDGVALRLCFGRV